MQKILFITTAYVLKNSSAAIRNNSLVKGLVELGYEVDVYTIRWPQYLFSSFFASEKNGNIHFDQLPNLIRISQLKQFEKPLRSISCLAKIRKFFKQIIFFFFFCYEWKSLIEVGNLRQYKCLITSSDHKSSHFVGMKIKRLVPTLLWIQVWGDPWSRDVNTLLFMRKLVAYFEKKLLSKSDKIVYVSEVTKNEVIMKYPQFKDKIYYIPRGFYKEVDTSYVEVTSIKIVYTGVLSYGRNPFVLLDVVSKKLNGHNWVVEFYGSIPIELKNRLLDYPFVRVYESVDFESIPTVLASATVLLYLSNKKGSSQIPGKFFDYLGTTKPVLCLVDDEMEPTSLFLKRFQRCLVLENSETTILDNWDKISVLFKQAFVPEVDYSPKSIASCFVKLF